MEHTVRPRPAQSTRIRSLRPRREPPPGAPRRARGARDASRPYPAPTRSSSAGFSSNVEKKSSPPSFSPPTSAARRALRRGDPEQGQGEEAREAPADPDRDHGGGGEGEAGEEGGQEGSQGASPIPTFAPLFRVSIGTTDPSPPRIFPSGCTTRETDPLLPSRFVVSQEAKKEARIEREEFEANGGAAKKLTKKERKRLEAGEFE